LQRGSVGVKFDWQYLLAYPRKPPYRHKNLADIFYTSRVLANFVPNFVAMATGVGRRKCDWQNSIAHRRKPLYRNKNLADMLHKASYSQFCHKFRCHGNGGRSGENAIGSIRWPIPKNPPIDANISQISLYADQAIANFVPNFVAMATRESPG